MTRNDRQRELAQALNGADVALDSIEGPDGQGPYVPGVDFPGAGGGDGAVGVVPDDETVASIADAVADNQYVRLKPTTYTHNGTASISHVAGDGRTVVVGHGATIQVRGNPTVDIDEASNTADQFEWHGGVFLGSESAGEVAFDISDSVWCTIAPARIEDCEVGVAAFNEDLWCEFLTLDFQGKNNECTVALLGQNANDNTQATPPTGSSLRQPDNSSGTGTWSFRNAEFNFEAAPRESPPNLSTSYGLYTDQCKLYASTVETSMGGNVDCVGMYLGTNNNLDGTDIQHHYEEPGSVTQGGTGLQIEDLIRPPTNKTSIDIAASASPRIQNNASEDFYFWNSASTDGGQAYGPELYINNYDKVIAWTDAFTSRSDGAGMTIDGTVTFRQDATGDEFFRFHDSGNNAVIRAVYTGAGNLRWYSNTGSQWMIGGGPGSTVDVLLNALDVEATGSSSDPAVEIGTGGAGFFVDGTGEVVVVDEAGNTTTLS